MLVFLFGDAGLSRLPGVIIKVPNQPSHQKKMISEIASAVQLLESLKKMTFCIHNPDNLPRMNYSFARWRGNGPMLLFIEFKQDKDALSIKRIDVKNLLIQPVMYDRNSINFDPIKAPLDSEWRVSVSCAINIPSEGAVKERSPFERKEGFVTEAFWAKPLNISSEITVTAVSTDWFTSLRLRKAISFEDI